MGRLWKLLGPGILMAAAAVGGSHLVISPSAGAAFGYQLLWLVPLACALRYHAFEFGPRFAIATGTSLLEGYGRVPGPSSFQKRPITLRCTRTSRAHSEGA